MAIITLVLTSALSLAFLHYLTHFDRRYDWLLLIGLLSSFMINRWVKIPVITSIAAWTDVLMQLSMATPVWFVMVIWLNAPIFEEAVKILPFALPAVRKLLNDAQGSLWAGLALGLSFGLGEAAYMAYGVAQGPEYNSLPWYMFTGFAAERLMVTFGHGFLTSIAAYGFYKGGRNAFIGYFSAVGLHALINLGPILLALKFKPEAVFNSMSYVFILVAFLLFQRYARDAKKLSRPETDELVYFAR